MKALQRQLESMHARYLRLAGRTDTHTP
jgi:hypothetical protein